MNSSAILVCAAVLATTAVGVMACQARRIDRRQGREAVRDLLRRATQEKQQ